MNNSQYYLVKIKQEQIPWTWNQHNHDLRRKKQEENARDFQNNFYTLINKVVSMGGTVCMDKYSLDSEWRMYNNQLRVRVNQETFEVIRTFPFIEEIAVDLRRT